MAVLYLLLGLEIVEAAGISDVEPGRAVPLVLTGMVYAALSLLLVLRPTRPTFGVVTVSSGNTSSVHCATASPTARAAWEAHDDPARLTRPRAVGCGRTSVADRSVHLGIPDSDPSFAGSWRW